MTTSLTFSKNYASYTSRLRQWRKVRDCIEGEDAVKDAGKLYLPQPGGQSTDQYNGYKERAAFYGVAERTLRGLSGMVFRNDPTLELPERLEPMREALTTEGYSFDTLIAEVVREVLSTGRYGILPDFAPEADANAVPYFATYFADDIADWETQLHGAKVVLTKVLLRERAFEQGTEENEERYRELCLDDGVYTQRVWQAVVEKSKDDGTGSRRFALIEETVPSVGGKTLDYIPFVFINPYDLRPEIEKPPFLDLCNVNLSHYRNSADYEHALYMTAQPTPWCSGAFNEKNTPSSIGPHSLWVLPEGGSAGMLEFTGAGIKAQRDAMSDKEDRMAALGARMIVEGRSRNEAAETARMRGRGEMSLLVSVVKSVNEAFERLFRRAADWVSSDPDEVVITLNRDFVETRMEAKELDSIVKAWQSGAVSRMTLHENLQRGEIVPPSRSVEDEMAMIDEEAFDVSVPETDSIHDDDDGTSEADRVAADEDVTTDE